MAIDSVSPSFEMKIDSASSPPYRFRFSPDRSEKEEQEEDCTIVWPPRSDDMDLFWKQNEKDPVGAAIVNVGNTCYVSASLQCIVHTVPMILKLRASYQSHSCAELADKEEDYFCSLCALRRFVESSIERSGREIYPYSFTNNLRKISNDFLLGQQEDAHEFLRCLLDNLHNCCLGPRSKDKPFTMDEDSLVKHVFGGRLISQLRCSECGYCSNNSEPLLDLSLDIAEADSLLDAFQSFTKTESIEEKFTCGGCKAQVLMEKQTKIDQAPEVISLHLKRFKNDGFFTQKIIKYVEYPLELDLKPFISCPKDDEQTVYDLYAVLVHNGILSYGHYYSYVRSSPNTWHSMNDEKVITVSETDVLQEKNAYILFYIKKGSSPWFSTLMDAQKLNETSPSSVLDRSLNPSSGEESSSSSSSRETSEKDEGTRIHIDGTCDSIISEPCRDISVHSSTLMETTESDEGPCPHNDTSYDSIHSQQHRDSVHSHQSSEAIERDEAPFPHNDTPSISQKGSDGSLRSSPCNIVNRQNGTLPTSRFRNVSTKRTSPNHICIDMPDGDSSALKVKGKKEVGETTPTTPKNVDPNISKLLRTIPFSRRSGLMRCLPPSSKNIGKRASLTSSGRPLTSNGRPLDKKMKVFDFHSDCEEYSHPQYHPRSLSPRSLSRGFLSFD